MHPFTMFIALIAVHMLCDYPLQGEFLAKGKNHTNPIPGIPWGHCLFAHAMIHGFGVAIVTQSVILGIFETLAHLGIDYTKSSGRIGYNTDQFLHMVCKFVWVYLALIGVRGF